MKNSIAIILLLSLMTLSCAGEEKVVLGNESYGLSDEEISLLSEQANAGSIPAAIKLSDRYFYDLSLGKTQEMRAKALEWTLVGAENGSAEAQFRVYQLLSTSDENSKKIRALFWLKQSAKHGNDHAQGNLEECPTIDAKRPSGTPCFGESSDD